MEYEYAILAALLLFSLCVSAAWNALAGLSGGRVRRMEEEKPALAEKAEEWLENRARHNTVFRFLLSCGVAFIAVLLYRLAWRIWPAPESGWMKVLIAGASTSAVVVLLESASFYLLLKGDIRFLRVCMPVIDKLGMTLFFPFVRLPEMIRGGMDRNEVDNDAKAKATTEDEIMSLLKEDDEPGNGAAHIEEDEKRMIRGIFELDDTFVREIMTPRVDIKALPQDAGIDKAMEFFIETGHSRIPVFRDNIDDISGILYAKDFLNSAEIQGRELEKMSHRPIFIPETKMVADLLEEVKKNRNHFAVVIDEYGGTAGIVTLEDMIEEIVGEIRDEYDVHEDGTPMYVLLSPEEAIFDARTLVSDVNETMDLKLSGQEDVDTIGGFICGESGRIPLPGEKLIIGGNTVVEILKADRRKILKVKISREDGNGQV